jgi:hypothetical protein
MYPATYVLFLVRWARALVNCGGGDCADHLIR